MENLRKLLVLNSLLNLKYDSITMKNVVNGHRRTAAGNPGVLGLGVSDKFF
jgi:hypothetical protein